MKTWMLARTRLENAREHYEEDFVCYGIQEYRIREMSKEGGLEYWRKHGLAIDETPRFAMELRRIIVTPDGEFVKERYGWEIIDVAVTFDKCLLLGTNDYWSKCESLDSRHERIVALAEELQEIVNMRDQAETFLSGLADYYQNRYTATLKGARLYTKASTPGANDERIAQIKDSLIQKFQDDKRRGRSELARRQKQIDEIRKEMGYGL